MEQFSSSPKRERKKWRAKGTEQTRISRAAVQPKEQDDVMYFDFWAAFFLRWCRPRPRSAQADLHKLSTSKNETREAKTWKRSNDFIWLLCWLENLVCFLFVVCLFWSLKRTWPGSQHCATRFRAMELRSRMWESRRAFLSCLKGEIDCPDVSCLFSPCDLSI